MQNKRIPPPPVLPPVIKIDKNFCLLHKGTIQGDTYICPSCKTKYCMQCAKRAEQEVGLCVKCKSLITL
ncbi:MAG: hypothetical protein ACXAEX_08140 [Promethearchaeota archaeon]|jgi:hypothetical protein